MRDAGLNLTGIGLVTAGAVLAYSGVNDPQGGPIGVVRDLLRGRTPTPGTRLVTEPLAGTQVMGAAYDPIAGLVEPPDVLNQHSRAAINAGIMVQVLQVARSYLGTPYRLGGASRTGIDCSGLVMVAYRDGAGIKLPHKATLQAARARKIPDDQARPGDLVAWGVPGNYPHIALVVDRVTCIGAWTWGVPCSYDKIHQKAVPGFGYPDILRVIG